MNPCPHPVESAQRAARDLTMAWARNLTLLDAGDEDKTITPRRERREGVPSPEEMAAEYIKVRDLILAAPVTPPGARP
jgi:hypothetical protein